MNRTSQFLAAYRACGNITAASKAAGISRDLHHRRMRKDPEYASAFEMAKHETIDLLEEEARRRAVDGVMRDVWFKGVVCGQEMVYSDSLLQFLLRGARPDVYRENRLELTGRHGAPVESNITVTFVKPE